MEELQLIQYIYNPGCEKTNNTIRSIANKIRIEVFNELKIEAKIDRNIFNIQNSCIYLIECFICEILKMKLNSYPFMIYAGPIKLDNYFNAHTFLILECDCIEEYRYGKGINNKLLIKQAENPLFQESIKSYLKDEFLKDSNINFFISHFGLYQN